MNDSQGRTKVLSRIADAWSVFCYRTGFGPPPWHREELIDSIDFGDHLIAELRVYKAYDGRQLFLIELWDRQQMRTRGVLNCCDLEAVIRLLTESQSTLQQYKTRQ